MCWDADLRRDKAVRKRYKIPLGTKVEIISGCSDNGRIGTLGAKETGGLIHLWMMK